ncbi:tetratricopeptide repeat protein [Motiliproteus sediminis]|uniref:tetratricopeptide repeat protein n=1 Tax=Motiliproteus sediminis TaxID=1468178 RepID=UPI001AEF6EFD|nr:tetratricopeptide repeat protein [Motiliproteus sediminis]
MANYLADKSVLIVAKKLEDLGELRALVAETGARDVLVASSANMAFNLLRSQPFDVCLVEYRLGEGEKNGFQVIEEASREGLRRAVDIYALVSPEKSELLSHDSVDVIADTQFLKPVQPVYFHQRLEKLLKVKKAVYPVESLVDNDELDKALLVMDKLLRQFPSLRSYLDRVRGRLLLKLERWAEAAEHFKRVQADTDLPWSHTGLGICAYHQGLYEDALAYFNQLLGKVPDSIEAYDWLSRVYRGVGRNGDAQKVLEKAIQVLPTAPALQSGLGDVASENSDWDTAIKAFRGAVRFARHSVYKHQNNYFGLARCLQTRVSPHGGMQSSEASTEAVRTLEDVVEQYFDNQLIRFKSKLMTSETYKKSGDISRANVAAKDAFEVFRQLSDGQQAEELDNLLEGVEGTNQQDAVEEYRTEFNRRVFSETEWGQHNLAGMNAYRKGHFDDALKSFMAALDAVPNSPSVMLNLVQTGYELIRQQPERSGEILALCNSKLLRMSIGAMNSKQQERYRFLSQRRAELAAGSSRSGGN